MFRGKLSTPFFMRNTKNILLLKKQSNSTLKL